MLVSCSVRLKGSSVAIAVHLRGQGANATQHRELEAAELGSKVSEGGAGRQSEQLAVSGAGQLEVQAVIQFGLEIRIGGSAFLGVASDDIQAVIIFAFLLSPEA